ncbi:DNA polymerase epsilon subunit 1 [Nematocida displodere]|uniref:DNA polymerase epsilon catalytic subunit n=1 Tax=Nematocida displodere TaxID=1805483 RepID=A0A177ED14_9MICR|nr:DNA polymerase epsilon subunit 1 [Nematocida displodere]
MHALMHPDNTGLLMEYFGYDIHREFGTREGWLLNYQTKDRVCAETDRLVTHGVLFFVGVSGANFRIEVPFFPRFTLSVDEMYAGGVEEYLLQKYATVISKIQRIEKTDLQEPNHLAQKPGKSPRAYLSIMCYTEKEAFTLRQEVDRAVKENIQRAREQSAIMLFSKEKKASAQRSLVESIFGVHEYDIPVGIQMSIQMNLNAGKWYTIEYTGQYSVKPSERVFPPDLRSFSFDIETTKDPLKFPNAEKDKVMMISIMSSAGGWLIVNREVVGEDIAPFEFWPTADIGGEFDIYNEPDERSTLQTFLTLVQTFKPHIMATYNGDMFDWPFVEKRLEVYKVDMGECIGIKKNAKEEYVADFILHLDCFRWVKRDSYLPAGSHGLKSVTRAKLGYFPDEIDPEDMLAFASTRPRVLASYSVSDAIATHFLYMKYVHPFIFSLATLIPLPPDDVLRQGSGALCEGLLMKEAHGSCVLIPPKKRTSLLHDYNGRIADSLSYVGGHVECLQSGIFRSDFEYNFSFKPEYLTQMMENVDAVIALELDGATATNTEEIKEDIQNKLQALIEMKTGRFRPHIYHLDVGAMYPNIILTNRLQPVAVTSERNCAQCEYYQEKDVCQRTMQWKARAEVFAVDAKTAQVLAKQVREETNRELPYEERLKSRVIEYAKKISRRTREIIIEEKQSTICQRENPFYVNAVRTFRDRRNEYKRFAKKAAAQAATALKTQTTINGETATELGKKAAIYDSLQIAHKCVLNSFYGYVMKKGARWYSMEMAAVVCQTGSSIIQRTKAVIDAFGIPLELDTDGIWALFPESFPHTYTLNTPSGPCTFSYICAALNQMLVQEFTNPQYLELQPGGEYRVSAENSIRFEIDGPYRAMFIPGSAKEGESIKKRYIVINAKEKISELKGFEFKRRGELKFVKSFQEELFNTLLLGKTLEECYFHLSVCANYWIDIIESQGESLADEEIFEYFGERRSMSKEAHEYAAIKTNCLTAAERLAEFLEQPAVAKGTSCAFIIAKYPEGDPVTSRAIPQSVFYAPVAVRQKYLKKWTGARVLPESVRDLIDWSYYLERLTNVITKIIIVPSALQGLKNPIPRITPPKWTVPQSTLTKFLQKKPEAPQQIPTHAQKLPTEQTTSQPAHYPNLTGYFSLKKQVRDPPSTFQTRREDKRETLPPAAAIAEITKHTFVRVVLKDGVFIHETLPLNKVFYLQADLPIIERLLVLYNTLASGAGELSMEKVRCLGVELAGDKNFLKITVNSHAFESKFHKYAQLFESPEVRHILELDAPPEARALECTGYQKLPVISLAHGTISGKTVYAVHDTETRMLEEPELLEYFQKQPPSLLFTLKTPPDTLPRERFLVIPQEIQAAQTIQGAAAAKTLLLAALERLKTAAETATAVSEYSHTPLLFSPSPVPYLQLNLLYYLERRKRNIVGWGDTTSELNTHYALGCQMVEPFRKEFTQEGVYEGLSATLHVSGAILLGIIESDVLLKEESASTKQTPELQALQSLIKKLVYTYIRKETGASQLIQQISGWARAAHRDTTLTDTVLLHISLLQTKFLSGVVRAIKTAGCDIVQTECEEITVFTRRATQQLADAQIQHAMESLSSLEYGSLLNVEVGQWYARIVMIDRANFHFALPSGQVEESFAFPIPEPILLSLLGEEELPSLEYLRETYDALPQSGMLLARLLFKIYALKFDAPAYGRKVAAIVRTSAFSETLTRPFGRVVSLGVGCPCFAETTFYAPLTGLTGPEEIEAHFMHLIQHRQKIEMHCKSCSAPFSRTALEEAICSKIYDLSKTAIKKEKLCQRCKKPAPGLITTRCACGGQFERDLPSTFTACREHLSSLSSLVPTVTVISYCRRMLRHLTQDGAE